MSRRYWPLVSALLGVITLASLGEAQTRDPFVPGLRWTHSAPLDAPWIPESAWFGADGEMVWASGNFGSPRLMMLASAGEILGEVVREDDGVTESIVVLSAMARSSTGTVFSIAQYADPDSLNRRTEVSRYDPLTGSTAPALDSSWTREAGFVTNGPARVVCDAAGRSVVAAVWNSATGLVQLDWIAGSHGALVRRVNVPMSGVNVLDISDDGRRVLLTGGLDLYVLDSLTGNIVHGEVLSSSTNAVSISGDGSTIAIGSFSQMRVLREINFVFQPILDLDGGVNMLPTRVDLSEDGDTMAVGWWNYITSSEVRFELIDVAGVASLNSYSQVATPGGLQNFPQVVKLTGDGRRAAFGAWGAGGPEPEVVLIERSVPTPILAVDLPGSVRSLDLDPTGTRLIVGSKNTHANQFATTGELRLYETGEKDLVQLQPARMGENLEFAAKRSGANAVVFVVGVKGFGPSRLPGFGGMLALTRRLPFHVEVVPADVEGRADASLTIPFEPAWTGQELSVQAVFRMGGGVRELSQTCVTPLIF